MNLARRSKLGRRAWVDLDDGSDTGLGTSASPYATIARASRLVEMSSGDGTVAVAVGGEPSGLVQIGSEAFTPVVDGSQITTYPYWLSSDGATLFSAKGLSVRYSLDDGDTWTIIRSWPTPTNSVDLRQLDNGELLVATYPGESGNYVDLWLSEGFPTLLSSASWSKVHTFTTSVAYPAPFSWSTHENIVLVSEYGPKTGGTANARYVYLSTDYGETWSTIYDLGAADGNHLHGVAYDPWWERIWVTYGDDTSGTIFSDDLGETWNVAHSTEVVAGPHQNCDIMPMADHIIFGTDVNPNGVQRITRSQGRHSGTYTIDSPYVHNSIGQITHVNQLIFRRPDCPALVFMPPGVTAGSTSFVVATSDGENFVRVWEDTWTGAIGFTGTVLGPTALGNLLIHQADSRHGAGTRSLWRGPMPEV